MKELKHSSIVLLGAAAAFCCLGLVKTESSLTASPLHPPTPSSLHATHSSPLTRLTSDGYQKQHPAWSPDGTLVAFTIYKQGKVGLVQMAPGASEWKHITPFDDSPEYEPSWSADGKRIVFVHVALSGTDGQLEIHTMNADSTDSRRIVAPAKRPAQDEHPAWSPDGKAIAFTTTRDGNQEIYLCDADGTNLRRITSHPAIDSHPSWSPDGQRIAYCSSRFGNMEICVMDSDGSSIRRLTDHPAMDYQPKWSPDGKWLAFTSTRDGNYEVYVISPDGTRLRCLSDSYSLDKDPAWTPDSAQVTFVSNRGGKFDLYSIAIAP